MNHNHIADQDVIGQYRRGALAAEDAAAFEEHLLNCAECRELLEADSRLERGLRSNAAGVIARRPSSAVDASRSAYFALAAASAVLAIAATLQWQTTKAPVPYAGVPVYELTITRSGGTDATEIRVPSNVEWYVLEVEAPEAADCCLVVIEDGQRELVWKGDVDVHQNEGVVRVLLGRNYLRGGDYRISLLSMTDAELRLAEHRFQLKFEG